MTFNEAQAEFAVRYYRWAREEFRSEVEHRFPLLTKLNTRTSKACLHLMGRLAVNDQLNFAAALVKRFHKQAVQLAGESLSSEETNMIHSHPIRGKI